MIFDFSGLSIYIDKNTASEKAAKLFQEEIELRTNKTPSIAEQESAPCVSFFVDEEINCKDSYKIQLDKGVLRFYANGIRGLIFAYSMFLRKILVNGEQLQLIKDISGDYSPFMKIRGHQLGYRTTPNTYDAWHPEHYHRYYRDMMFFGVNTCEQMPGHGENTINWLMKYDPDDMLVEASKLADELDMDVSIWYPNDDDTIEESLVRRREVFEMTPRLDAYFPPGGDPGSYDGDEFVERVRAAGKLLKEIKPDAQVWPSAQKPHEYPNWAVPFIEEMNKLPEEIDGVITGPNWALPLDELRRQLPMRYPIRLYPDITHNVRCEYPVHFPFDDWHYALTNGLSRESINPRPVEYRKIHRLTRQYIVGSVSYSEGVHDDINKMIWSDMDYFGETSLRESLMDYSRVFFWGVPAEPIVDGIFGLEQNWIGDPAENGHIENTLRIFDDVLTAYPHLIENWRFVMCLFRAKCDAIIKHRRIFELSLLEDAKYHIIKGDIQAALAVLNTDYNEDYKALRQDIEELAERLFKQIGLQLDVERYGTNSWERGATLDTIDQPVTDRAWLLNRIEYSNGLEESKRQPFLERVLSRNSVSKDEFYFSFSEHGTEVLNDSQEGFIYYNFQGDRPNVNNGSIPMSMLKVFDNIKMKAKIGGLDAGCDYELRVSFLDKTYPVFNQHYIKINGKTLYEGRQFGGRANPEFDKEMLHEGFVSASYKIPADWIENGCIDLEMGEPLFGVMLSEFWIVKAKN